MNREGGFEISKYLQNVPFCRVSAEEGGSAGEPKCNMGQWQKETLSGS